MDSEHFLRLANICCLIECPMRANAKHHMFILFIDLSAMFFIDHRLNKRQQNRDYDWWGEELIVMILILLDLIVHASFLEIISYNKLDRMWTGL